jgi:hypothetical protein
MMLAEDADVVVFALDAPLAPPDPRDGTASGE